MIPTIHDIIDVSSDAYGIPVKSLLSDSKRKSTVECRGVVVWFARTILGMSWHEIGDALCVHHTSAMVAFRRIDRESSNSVVLRGRMSQIATALEGQPPPVGKETTGGGSEGDGMTRQT